MSRPRECTVIGPGAVGSALLCEIRDAGYTVRSVVVKSERSICSEQGIERVVPFSELEANDLGDWIFLTTPDDRIEPVSARLASLSDVPWRKKSVTHLSGVAGSDALGLLRKRGARTASCHPLQTFVRSHRPMSFRKVHLTMEGDPTFLTDLRLFWEHLGAIPHEVTRDQKIRIHLSAVFLSNYLVSLASVAEDLFQEVIPDADLSALSPLLKQTTSNLLDRGAAGSLTGPIERGDLETIRRHLDLMKEEPERRELYGQLGLIASRLAARNGQKPDVTEAVQDLLVGKKKP